MNPLEISELGEIIRKVRRSRGLTLTDLADENISQATISNMSGVLLMCMLIRYTTCCESWKIQDKLSDLLTGEQKELQRTHFRLFMIESLIRVGKLEKAEKELDRIVLVDDHPYAALYYLAQRKSTEQPGKMESGPSALFTMLSA